MGDPTMVDPNLSNLLYQASGGLFRGQPVQQIFEMPAPQAAMQQPVQQPGFQGFPIQQQQGAPAQQQGVPVQQQTVAQPQAQEQMLHQAPAPQVAQVGPPGSVAQTEYEKMRESTSKFLKGMIDGSLPYIAKEAVKLMSAEDVSKIAEAENQKAGFFDTWYGKTAIGAGGAIIGAGTLKGCQYLFGGSKSSASGEDIAALGKAIKTLLG